MYNREEAYKLQPIKWFVLNQDISEKRENFKFD